MKGGYRENSGRKFAGWTGVNKGAGSKLIRLPVPLAEKLETLKERGSDVSELLSVMDNVTQSKESVTESNEQVLQAEKESLQLQIERLQEKCRVLESENGKLSKELAIYRSARRNAGVSENVTESKENVQNQKTAGDELRINKYTWSRKMIMRALELQREGRKGAEIYDALADEFPGDRLPERSNMNRTLKNWKQAVSV